MFASAKHDDDCEAPWPMVLALATLTAMFVTDDGRSTWFVGAQETYWEGVDPTAAKRMRLASTHWLRHANGSHADAAGVSLETIRRNLGHSSLQTTAAYIHAEDDRRWRGTSKLGCTRRPVE